MEREERLFIMAGRFERLEMERSRFGYWMLNPRLFNIAPSWGMDPNTGEGLDPKQLAALIKSLSRLEKRLTRVAKKRGPKPSTKIAACVAAYKKHFQPDIPIREVWAKVRKDLRLAGHSSDEWLHLRIAAKQAMKREALYTARRGADSARRK